MLLLLVPIALLQTPQDNAQAQREATFQGLIRKNLYPLRMAEGRLAGPGADFLLSQSQNAQFVALGEEHFVREIPEITTALFRDLQRRHGYQYLCVENGPVAMRDLADKPLRGNLPRTVEFLKRYPMAIPFNSDQDIRMMVDIGALSRGKSRPLWGLDQEFGVLHVLDKLGPLATTDRARQAIANLRRRVERDDTKRDFQKHFISRTATARDFSDLRNAISPKPGTFEDFATKQLALSQEVYGYYSRPAEEEPVGRLNNLVREENMKDLLMDEYRLAQRRGDRLPKALLKFGQWHLFRGMSPGSIFPMGNFISEFAKSNGMSSLHVYFASHNPAGGFRPALDKEWLKPFAQAAPVAEWTLVDLRPLRNYWHAGRIPRGTVDFQRMIFGYDVLFLLGGASPATSELTEAP